MRRLMLCIGVGAMLLTGCSSNETVNANKTEIRKAKDDYIKKFDEKYLNLPAFNASDIDDLSKFYHEEYESGVKRGYTAVIVGKDETLTKAINLCKEEYDSYEKMYQGIKKKAKAVDVAAYFKKQKKSVQNIISKWEKKKSSVESYEAFNELYILSNDTYLMMIPSEKPYEIFAYLPMGNFNSCPDNDVLLAVFKHWYEEYGVIPAVITYDTIHVSLTKTLDDKQIEVLVEEMVLLNMETQMLTYPAKEDIVKGLKHSKYWMFWWD